MSWINFKKKLDFIDYWHLVIFIYRFNSVRMKYFYLCSYFIVFYIDDINIFKPFHKRTKGNLQKRKEKEGRYGMGRAITMNSLVQSPHGLVTWYYLCQQIIRSHMKVQKLFHVTAHRPEHVFFIIISRPAENLNLLFVKT